jgi:hypothetical protein
MQRRGGANINSTLGDSMGRDRRNRRRDEESSAIAREARARARRRPPRRTGPRARGGEGRTLVDFYSRSSGGASGILTGHGCAGVAAGLGKALFKKKIR